MELSSLTAISPIDGRYGDKVNIFRSIFSEYGLFKFRLKVEIYWLKALSNCKKIKEIPFFNKNEKKFLDNIFKKFNEKDAQRIKDIEFITKHDIKAVEYFLKEKIIRIPTLKKISEFVHFACTSEDINNLSYALMLKKTRQYIIIPHWKNIINSIKKLALKYNNIPLISRTHGQPATPSTIGKEFANVIYRMERQVNQLINIEIMGKINGAVGNYNAHMIAYPEINWHLFSKNFVNSLGLIWNPFTTQIEPHDYLAELFNCIVRFNIILIDFNRDMWGYLSLNYFKQKITKYEIGSSTMPHKINPIDFENSEGNLGLSNAILNHLSNKLPISRWQRDMSDSTVLRNIGVGFSYMLIAYQASILGISKLKINKMHILDELNNNWAILAEPIQTVMRRYGIKKPYEKLKELTRNKNINSTEIQLFIDTLKLPEKEKKRLKKITPDKYIGYAITMVNKLNFKF
ncbi:Adenylosuccinate lyase [Serratia symbiotica]|nr:Adenylosuccinate lyase [Serratia symbiotica]